MGHDPIPIPVREVHVEIGRGDPFRIEESFEDQVVLQRVKVRDPNDVPHRAARAGTPEPDEDAVIPGVLHVVRDDQEVPREPHLFDDREFVFEPVLDPRGQLRIPLLRAAPYEMREVLVRIVEALRKRELGQPGLSEFDLHIAPRRDRHGVLECIRDI